MSKNEDYYKILGIRQNASKTEVREAYRTLVKKFHPDIIRNPHEKSRANESMKMINIAYNVLYDSRSREEYDKSIGVFNKSKQEDSNNNSHTNSNYQKNEKAGSPFDSSHNSNRNSYEEASSNPSSIFCPNCGQGHTLIDTKFCNKCGKSMTYEHKKGYEVNHSSRNSTVTSQKSVNEKMVFVLAVVGGFLGFNGIGHCTVGKIFLGIVIMIFGWFIRPC